MRTWLLALVLAFVFAAVPAASDANALGLKVAPLEYRTQLKKAERQRGFIDVSNPSAQSIKVRTDVQAFKQINDDGGLRFYDDEHTATGIEPELATFTLGPRQAIRIFFTIDGNKLPEGDVYAAIFFVTEPTLPQNGVGQQVRVGTLLSIVNRTPGERKAAVVGLNIPLFQVDGRIKGVYSIKNTGASSGGFYPEVTISAWPGNAKVQKRSSLVFGGRTRENEFSLARGFGIHKVTVSYGASSQSRWVVTLPSWAVLIGVLILIAAVVEALLWYRRRHKSLRRPTSEKA